MKLPLLEWRKQEPGAVVLAKARIQTVPQKAVVSDFFSHTIAFLPHPSYLPPPPHTLTLTHSYILVLFSDEEVALSDSIIELSAMTGVTHPHP